MSTFSLNEFNRLVSNHTYERPSWRHGQILFNTLYDHWPDIANEIRETEHDPFYCKDKYDTRIYLFYDYLMKVESHL